MSTWQNSGHYEHVIYDIEGNQHTLDTLEGFKTDGHMMILPTSNGYVPVNEYINEKTSDSIFVPVPSPDYGYSIDDLDPIDDVTLMGGHWDE